MARVERLAAGLLGGILKGYDGVGATCAQLLLEENLSVPPIDGSEVLEQFIAADLAEKASNVRYPVVHVFCNKVSNKLREKFRTFSGTANLTVEIRVSHEHVSELHQQLQLYVESVTNVLDRRRGSWQPGVYYPGGYEITYNPVKRGGRNYVQSAQVQLEVHVSVD